MGADTRTRFSGAAAYFILSLPLFAIVAWPGLNNFFWCEDAMWLLRAGRFSVDPGELFSVYGRDFNPLFLVAVFLQTKLLGTSVLAANATSFGIHLASGFMLALLFEKLFDSPEWGAAFAAVWTISPHTDETLFWMGSRGHALSFLFFVSAWYFFERGTRRGRLASVVLFVAAILTKEIAIILPVTILLRVLLRPENSDRDLSWTPALSRAIRETRSLWIIATVYVLIRLAGFSSDFGGAAAVGAGGIELDPVFLTRKFCFLVSGFFELRFLHWESPANAVVAALFFGLVVARGGTLGRFAVLWFIVASLLILPIPKHSPRYEIYIYPAFLAGIASLILAPLRRAGEWATRSCLAVLVVFVVFQSWFVHLDELDYDMRSRYVEALADQWNRIAPEIPDGAVIAIAVSGTGLQPEINVRTRIAKLNAPISGGLWGIIAPDDFVGMAEQPRGRALIPMPPGSSAASALRIRHTDLGFLLDPGPPRGDEVVIGQLIPMNPRSYGQKK